MRSFLVLFLYRRQMSNLRPLILLFVLVGANAGAQDEPIVLQVPGRESLDMRAFRAIYGIEDPVFSATMEGVNMASYPVFYIGVPAIGLADFVIDGEADAGVRMAASQLATMGVVFTLKRLIRRARPYSTIPDVVRRRDGYSGPPDGLDPFSFPSGHSAVAFSIATSASLSYPEWYVIVPTMTWASATALARVWRGVHYPSDILVGAVIGTSMGILVHVLLVPENEPMNEATIIDTPPAFSFTIEF